MPLPRMPAQIAQDLIGLNTDERFQRVWNYLQLICGDWEKEIMSSLTPVDRREMLVGIHEAFQEVLHLPETAKRTIHRNENSTPGQAA